MQLWNDYNGYITKFVGVLLIFSYALIFASYNELNELLVSYSRAYRVEPSFKSKIVMLMSRVN
jgi:hypothetical protein